MGRNTLSSVLVCLTFCTPAVAQRHPTTKSSAVVLESGEGAFMTQAYWAEDNLAVETWCERRYLEGAIGEIVDSGTTPRKEYHNKSDWPKRWGNHEREVFPYSYTFAPLPQRTAVTCFYTSNDKDQDKTYNTTSAAVARNGYVLHRVYFQQGRGDFADMQYRLYVSKNVPTAIPPDVPMR